MTRLHQSKLQLSFNAPVTLCFSLICFLVFLADQITGKIVSNTVCSVYRAPLSDPLTYLRFIGHVFGHADWQHFMGNIMLILVLGPMLEERYGAENVLFVILITALVTGIVHFVFFPSIQLLGASGVVFAFILLSSFSGTHQDRIPITFLLVAIIYIGGEVVNGLLIHDNVSNLTHILGGAVGTVIGRALSKNSHYY